MTGGTPDIDVLTGRTLGSHYLVGERIGAGSMGVVYRVRHTLLRRDFAAKVLAPSLAEDAEARRRFLREAEGLVRITHPNVVPIRHFGEDGRLLYLVMDICEGVTLRELLLREGPLPADRAVQIVLQVLLGLDAAHWEGVIHRDLKPANILVASPGADRGGPPRVQVADFGLARVAESAVLPGPGSSASGTVAGTVAYMSPEQVRGDADVDARSDLFSLGSVLHEMLCGRPPFDGSSTLTVALAILEQPPAPLPEEGPRGVSVAVRGVLLRALEKDREKRFRTAGEMADALRSAVAGVFPAGVAPVRSGGRRTRVVAASVVLGALAVAALGAHRLLSPTTAPAAAARSEADRELAVRSLLDARFEVAAAAAGRLVDSTEETAEDHLLLGRALSGAEDPKALLEFDRAEASLGADPRLAMERARFRAQLPKPDLDAAIRELDRVLLRGPEPDALYLRVWLLERRAGELRSSGAPAADLDAVLARMASDCEVLGDDPWRGVADALEARARGDLDRALARARAAAEAHPDLAEAAFVSARICGDHGLRARRPADAQAARRWFERCLADLADAIARARRQPGLRLQGRDLVRFWRLSCSTKFELGDADGAAADYVNEIVARNGSIRSDLTVCAQHLQWAGRFRDALRTYDAARRAGEGDEILHGEGYCHMQIGRLKAEAGDLPGALGELDAAVAKYTAGLAVIPGWAAWRAYRAEAWLTAARIQRDEAAAACLAKAREDFEALEAAGAAGLPEVLFRRWEYHEALGDRAAALTDIRGAIAVGVDDTAAHHRRMAFSCIAGGSGPGGAGLLEDAVRAADGAERWNPQRAELSCILRGDARAAMAALTQDPVEKVRGLALAREDYAKAVSLAHLDARIRAEAHLRAAGACLAGGDAAAAVREAEDALRSRREPGAIAGSALFVNDYYLRSPLAAFHRRLSDAYAAADRPLDAAREDVLARALR